VIRNILIFGATSGIAESVARIYASKGARLFLVARNAQKLDSVAKDLTVRGAADVGVFVMDANDTGRIVEMVETAWRRLERIDLALVAHGSLPNQERSQADVYYAMQEFQTNAGSFIACLTALAEGFERQANGTIAVIGSVAGDRGRSSNYLYGAAKAAVDAFASGLRARMFKVGVRVLTVKPGFVDTPMTRDLSLPAAFVVSADRVAREISKSVESGKDVLYTPWFWRIIMLIIKLIPESLFKRMKL
jgi:short-subunit dehydrogenase